MSHLTNITLAGNFGIMTLKRKSQGQWMMAGIEFMSLDPALAKQAP
jgi:hypothetical protein